jgi:hypothetical protein
VLGVQSLRPGDVIVDAGFFATSIYERFADSRMGTAGQALKLRLEVPSGKAAAWIPAIHSITDQGELLFAPRTVIRVVSISPIGQDTEVTAEIS